MTEFKDTQRELYMFRLRLIAAMLFVLVCFGLLVARYLTLHRSVQPGERRYRSGW